MGADQSKSKEQEQENFVTVICYDKYDKKNVLDVYKPIADLWEWNYELFGYLPGSSIPSIPHCYLYAEDLQNIIQFNHDPEFLEDMTIEEKKQFIKTWKQLGIHTDNTYFYNYRLAIDLIFEHLDTKKLAEIQQIFKLDRDNIEHGVKILEFYERFLIQK